MECRIFLASLTAHTNGMIDGEWIDLTDNNAMDKIEAFMRVKGDCIVTGKQIGRAHV